MPLVNLQTGLPVGPGFVRAPALGGVLAGLPMEILQANLAAAQAAYHQLQTGAKIVSASYGQADGSKSVSYSAADAGTLTNYILQLQRALGLGGRRPMRPYY